jgi:dextranase
MVVCLLGSCKKEDEPIKEVLIPDVPVNDPAPVYSNTFIYTDKARYEPGDKVTFTLDRKDLPTGALVRYKHLNKVVEESVPGSANWTWTLPADDFKGYVAELVVDKDGDETIEAVIAIDASTKWTKFPRYGFLSDYSQIEEQDMDAVINNLNRFHINGIQFYDWHNKHHQPLPIENGQVASSWKDIINKDVYLKTVESYIKKAHEHNMMAMYYNLVYGAWDDAADDGVDRHWYVYKDNNHSSMDYHPLSSPFLSNLYVLDPSNSDWQNYYQSQNKRVYEFLDFDGFHMDQLGDRGVVYNYDGINIDLAQTFAPFINAMKEGNSEKYNVVNAVNQYGQLGIASAETDFLYTEVWNPNNQYDDLASIIRQNDVYGGGLKNTVLAAYVNYDLANNQGFFNTPSVLMTNAVIFAFGGSHLELGEHMLGKEYFPNNNLKMRPVLKTALIAYYDFLVAYQNLLRDGGKFNTVTLSSLDNKMVLSNWPAGKGDVAIVAKKMAGRQLISLINLSDATTTEWRDNAGIQVAPQKLKNAKLLLKDSQKVKSIWAASPDVAGGSPRSLKFAQEGENVVFELPELEYWTMIVVEY